MTWKCAISKHAVRALPGLLLSFVPTGRMVGLTGMHWSLGWPSDCAVLKHGWHWRLDVNALALAGNVLTWYLLVALLQFVSHRWKHRHPSAGRNLPPSRPVV